MSPEKARHEALCRKGRITKERKVASKRVQPDSKAPRAFQSASRFGKNPGGDGAKQGPEEGNTNSGTKEMARTTCAGGGESLKKKSLGARGK